MVMSGGPGQGPTFGGGPGVVKKVPGEGLDPETLEGAHFMDDGTFDKVEHYTFDQFEATKQLIYAGYRSWQLTLTVNGKQMVQKIWAKTKADVKRYSNNMGRVIVTPKPWLPVTVTSIVLASEEDGGSSKVASEFFTSPELEHLYEK